MTDEDQICYLKHMDALTGEAFLVGLFKRGVGTALESALFDGTGIPIEGATYQFEFPVPRGRIDIAMFHGDGTVTAIEVKDGRAGLQSVLAGIGQVTCYAVQIGMSRGAARGIRKALAYSRLSAEDDALVYVSCLKAGVIPIVIGDANEIRKASQEHISGVENAKAE